MIEVEFFERNLNVRSNVRRVILFSTIFRLLNFFAVQQLSHIEQNQRTYNPQRYIGPTNDAQFPEIYCVEEHICHVYYIRQLGESSTNYNMNTSSKGKQFGDIVYRNIRFRIELENVREVMSESYPKLGNN